MKRALLLLAMLGVVFTACRRIPMYESTSGVYMRLKLDLEQEQQFGGLVDFQTHPELLEKVNGKMPEMVRVCFYDAVSHELVAEDFLPPEGGFVNVAPGDYDVIIYSLGTSVTQVEGTGTRAGAYAFTSRTGTKLKVSGSPADAGDEDPEAEDGQPVIYEPDHLYVGRIADASIPVHSEGESSAVVLESELKRFTESWSLEVLAVEGAQYIAGVNAYLIGQAAGHYLWDRRSTNHPASLVCPLLVDVSTGQLWTVFNTFGKFPQAESDVVVYILVTTTAGARCSFIFDVTEQWLNPDNMAHRIVIDKLLEIPDDSYSGSGFEPVVSDWDVEEIEVIVE